MSSTRLRDSYRASRKTVYGGGLRLAGQSSSSAPVMKSDGSVIIPTQPNIEPIKPKHSENDIRISGGPRNIPYARQPDGFLGAPVDTSFGQFKSLLDAAEAEEAVPFLTEIAPALGRLLMGL
jgi:hypothetical protein